MRRLLLAVLRLGALALLVLLRTPECILLDKRRLFRESDAPSRSFGLMPRLDQRNKIYEDERTDEADEASTRVDRVVPSKL